MSILLDANEELAKLNHLLRCPREVRAYCKETIILSQQLVLPIRCAYYLVYLAYADLRSSRYDDAQVKIEGLNEILCLTKHHLQMDQENKPPLRPNAERNIDEITNNMQEMMLDCPVPDGYKKQFSPASPTLVIQPFSLPAFLSHGDDCDCFYCMSLEYQNLVLEKFRLDAFLNVKLNNFKISLDFFHGAVHFYELSCKKYETSLDTVAKFISYDLIPEFAAEMLSVYGFALVDYSYHLRRTGDKEEALNLTNKLIDLVYPRKIQHIYLYNEALFQKLGYLTEVPEAAPVVGAAASMDTLCPESDIVSTTPESKHSKVTVSVQYSPDMSLPKRRVKKCLPFNLSPNADSANGNKPQEKASPIPKIKVYSSDTRIPSTSQLTLNNESKTRRRKVHIGDDSDACKGADPPDPVDLFGGQGSCGTGSRQENTPAIRKPPKTPHARKKGASNGDTAQKPKHPSSAVHIFTDECKKSKKKLAVNEIPDTVSAAPCTPVSFRHDSDGVLKSKTRLLTDKLRRSSKKPEMPAARVGEDGVGHAGVANGKKLPSRRNLFDHGNEEKEPSVPQGGTIRKSTRTRKI